MTHKYFSLNLDRDMVIPASARMQTITIASCSRLLYEAEVDSDNAGHPLFAISFTWKIIEFCRKPQGSWCGNTAVFAIERKIGTGGQLK